MNPELRNWYLSNLGIVQYVPKVGESVTLQFHSDSVVGDTESELGPNSGQSHLVAGSKPSLIDASSVKSQVASVLELMDVNKAVDARTAEEKKPLPLNNTERTLASINPAVSFRLACWHPCDDLLVFNQLEPGGEPDSAQCQLLGNILRAVGRLQKSLPSPELIDWPMGRGSREGIDEGESGARAMLSVFLDARIKKHGVLWVLLMGEQASELLSPVNKSYAELLGETNEVPGGAKVITIRSLQEMLQDSGAKRQSWLAIKGLVDKK